MSWGKDVIPAFCAVRQVDYLDDFVRINSQGYLSWIQLNSPSMSIAWPEDLEHKAPDVSMKKT